MATLPPLDVAAVAAGLGRPPIEQACYWLARHARPASAPLSGRRETDVAIVGGGFTGLWTALYLKALDPSRDVVLAEQSTVAYGASGRNAGIVSTTIDHSHALAIAHFGRAEARRMAQLGRQNVEEMFGLLETHQIGCDLERTGTLHFALSPTQVLGLSETIRCARSLGVEDLRLLGRQEAQAELHSGRYEGALFDPSGALIDPVALALGLKRAAEALGVEVLEGTRIEQIAKAGAAVTLRTRGGEIIAPKVILGTSAYTHHLVPRARFRFLPLYDYVLVSEPLTDGQRAAIGWRGRQGATDVSAFFHYYRLTPDGRVLWGSSEAAYYRNNDVSAARDHSERHYDELRASFARHFPALADLAFPYAWGGPICATTRFTPFFGQAHGGKVLYALGYTGHGLATTHLAGKILAHMSLALPSDLLDLALVRTLPFPYPPEPLRSWAVRAVTRDLRRVDAGARPAPLLRLLDALGIGLSS